MPAWASSYLLTLISSVGASALLTTALIWLSKNLISERLKNAIKSEYDIKLESHKSVLQAEQDRALEKLRADNAQFTATLSSASSAFSAAQAAAHQEKLNAIKVLWEKVVHLRANIHPIAHLADLHGPKEFSGQMKIGYGKDMIAKADPSQTKEMGFEDKAVVERLRPFLGEPIYQLFHLFWFVPARIVGNIIMEKAVRATENEYFMDFPDIQRLLPTFLSPDEIEQLNKQTGMQVTFIRNKIEAKMLEAIQDLISGKSAGHDALKNSESLAKIMEESRAKLPKETAEA